MLVWLDGISNVKAKPQENFARELMELFTIGVGEFAESDVYAAARVFTGWNLARSGTGKPRHTGSSTTRPNTTPTPRISRFRHFRPATEPAHRLAFRHAAPPTACRTAWI